MKKVPYYIYDILAWIPYKIQILCDKYLDWLWNLCHYKYGNGPKPISKYKAFD